MKIKYSEAAERLQSIKIRNKFAAFLNNLDAAADGDQRAIQNQLKAYFGDLEHFFREAESIYKGYEVLAMSDSRSWNNKTKRARKDMSTYQMYKPGEE